MATNREAVYCTLLISDDYLPGAVVLAHSLRDNGAKAKIVALFTPETLKESTVRELQSVYDDIIPVQLLSNSTPANLLLMDRLDLIASFTKIELWRQTQFSKIVYMDADVVALRAPDELLSLEEDFAAAPDIGWPDIFNSGVMVLRPNMQDYYALRALAERGISFDGGDQGLLNTHFKRWHRLSFTYNCTPSGNYQYMPAYRHFESTISLIHFIGSQKPWTQSRHAFSGGTPYYQLLGRWWAVYDRHYRSQPLPQPQLPLPASLHSPSRSHYDLTPATLSDPPFRGSASNKFTSPGHYSTTQRPPEAVFNETANSQRRTSEQLAGDLHVLRRSPISEGFDDRVLFSEPDLVHPRPVHPPSISHDLRSPDHAHVEPVEEIRSVVPLYVHGEEQSSVYVAMPRKGHESYSELRDLFSAQRHQTVPESYHSERADADPAVQPAKVPSPPPRPPPPPPPAQPEERPFSPPRSEWDASREPPPLHSRPEAISLETQTYTMSEDTHLFQPPPSYPEAPKNMYYKVPATKPKPERIAQIFPWEAHAPKPTRVFAEDFAETTISSRPGSSGTTDDEHQAEQPRPRPEKLHETTAEDVTSSVLTDSWQSYSRANAWDEVPEINRYIEAIQQRSKPSGKAGGSSARPASFKITDFPTEIDRPSLPVTPAPIRRSFWESHHQDEHEHRNKTSCCHEFPAAEGVPNQCDWNPLDRLEELRQRPLGLFKTPTPPPSPAPPLQASPNLPLLQRRPELPDDTDQPSGKLAND